MNNQPNLDTTHLRYADWLIANLILYGFFLAVFSPFTSIAIFAYERRQVSQRLQLVLLIASLVWFLGLSQFVRLSDILTIRYWLLSVPLFPVGALTLRGIRMFSNFSKPRTLQEHLLEEERKLRQQDARLEGRAVALSEINPQGDWLNLGAVIKSDIFPEHLGVNTKDGWLSFQ